MNAQELLKVRLMKDFETLVDRVLANAAEPEVITLRYAKKTAVSPGEKLKEVTVQELLKEHVEQ